MSDTDCGSDLVDILPAWPGGADECYEIEIIFGDFAIPFGFGKLRGDIQAREAGLAFVLGVKWRWTDEPMHAGFDAHVAEGVFTLHMKGGALDAGLLTVLAIDFGDIPAAVFPEVEVHPHEHLGPVEYFGGGFRDLHARQHGGTAALRAEGIHAAARGAAQ